MIREEGEAPRRDRESLSEPRFKIIAYMYRSSILDSNKDPYSHGPPLRKLDKTACRSFLAHFGPNQL